MAVFFERQNPAPGQVVDAAMIDGVVLMTALFAHTEKS
jgi:crotonobetainyl-CoA:carnitine CoA-transferase CaiB-like acyl-CoA transferase